MTVQHPAAAATGRVPAVKLWLIDWPGRLSPSVFSNV